MGGRKRNPNLSIVFVEIGIVLQENGNLVLAGVLRLTGKGGKSGQKTF